MMRISRNRSDTAQDLRIFTGVCTYDIENRGKGGRDEAGSRICPVLCGAWHGCGVGSAQSVCGGGVVYILFICRGKIFFFFSPVPFFF